MGSRRYDQFHRRTHAHLYFTQWDHGAIRELRFITSLVENFTVFRFVGVTEFNYSLKQLLQTRLSTSLRLTMKTAHLPKAWSV